MISGYLRGDNRFLCVRENHEENKNKDLSSTICEYVRLECMNRHTDMWTRSKVQAS